MEELKLEGPLTIVNLSSFRKTHSLLLMIRLLKYDLC